METSISKKASGNHQISNLVNILEGKRFNEVLMAVVSIAAILVILWG